MVQRRLQLTFIVPLLLIVLVSSGCPKDPYSAAVKGSADISSAVSGAIGISAQYYTAGTINAAQKSKVATYLAAVTDCNVAFRGKVVAAHNSGTTGNAIYLTMADGLLVCIQGNATTMNDPRLANIVKAVDTALNGVSLAIATAKGASN